MRREVVKFIFCYRDVDGAGVVGRDFDRIDLCVAEVGRRDLRPCLASITSELDEAVVGAGPQGVLVVGRLGYIEDRIVDFPARAFVGDGASARALGLVVGVSQVGADLFPGASAVFALQ